MTYPVQWGQTLGPNFLKYAMERELVRLRRAAGVPGPWTTDLILASYRFCNVFREDDKVTMWVERKLRRPYADSPNLWFALAIARIINWPPTLEEWMRQPGTIEFLEGRGPFPAMTLAHVLDGRVARKEKAYTGAYMIRAESDRTKGTYIAKIVLGRLWSNAVKWDALLRQDGLTLERVWEEFQHPSYVGWGPFMAYEVVTDLRHTRYLEHAPDIGSWANAGPGALRGLNRIFGRPLKHAVLRATSLEEMRALLVLVKSADAELFCPGWNHVFESRDWEMRDVEHTLCEFDKYERVRNGQGRPRSTFSPSSHPEEWEC